MKRFAPFLAVLAALALALPALASPRLARTEIGWRVTSQGNLQASTAIFGRDTTISQFGQGGGVYGTAGADTTAWFSPSGLGMTLPPSLFSSATGDTVVYAWVVLCSDSSSFSTSASPGVVQTYEPTVSAATANLEGTGLWPGPAQAPVPIANFSSTSTASGDDYVITPLTMLRASSAAAGTNATNAIFAKVVGALNLRVRYSSITGALRRARAFLVYWTDSNSNP